MPRHCTSATAALAALVAFPRRGAGSGFIIDADGSILANHHVVDGRQLVTVRIEDR